MARYRYVEQGLGLIRRSGWWNPRLRRIVKAAPLVVVFLLLNARSARSATCSFNPTPDPTIDGSPTSLRHAIQMANASGQDCLITLSNGTYTLTVKNTNGHENTAAQGDLDITDSGHTVTIQGQGAAASIVNGNKIDRVFDVIGGAKAVFSNLTIEGGIARDNGKPGALPGTTAALGGGILLQGTGQASLEGVTLKGNFALGGNGANGGALSLSGPGGPGGTGQPAAGGGLYVASGSVDLSSSTVSGNAASGGAGGNGGEPGTSTEPSGPGGPGGMGAGGGLDVLSGSVKLSASTVSGNRAAGGAGGMGGLGDTGGAGGSAGDGHGGGLFVSGGALTLSASTVSANLVTGGNGGNANLGPAGPGVTGGAGGASRGAGMFVAGGSVSLANSTFFANTANNGGIGGLAPGLRLTPFSGPGGDSAGGGLFVAGGSVNLVGLTIASNHAEAGGAAPSLPGSSLGGGICNSGATSLVSDSTLIGNNTRDTTSTGGGPDVSGPITSSYSLISQTAGATITDKGHNIFGVDPLLDPGGLQQNGGATETVALEQGSPAIDAGNNVICQAPPPRGLGGVDQRGVPRSRPGYTVCDIGAFQFMPGVPFITSIPKVIEAGSKFVITGLDFTDGSKVNFFVSTATGAVNAGPFIPTTRKLPTQLTVTVPPTVSLGEGFVSVQVVNTDMKYLASNLGSALLEGNPAAGIPSLTSINGMSLAPTSSNPAYGVNNVETVVIQGSAVELGGSGFDVVHGVAVKLFCDCPGGSVGPFIFDPGDPGLTSSLIAFVLPASGANAPTTGPGSFEVINEGDGKASNAVSVPIGQAISVTSVTQSGDTITVNGTGFANKMTVLNLFNTQTSGVVNLGGLGPGGPKIALAFINSDQVTFTKPTNAMPGPSYVQMLNPPYTPFTTSGSGPLGSFTLK